RNEPVIITGASHKPPMGQNMFNQIKDFYYKSDNVSMNPVEYAAWTHAEFVRIHPFIDGNGRTSRLIMNYQLMLNGFPPISISVNDRLEYYEALDEYASKNDITKFYNMILLLVEKRLDEYIEIINNIK
ncbi:MAG: Fic family protein, partial [bacterium]